jgi:hypothetical protein
VTKLSEEIDRRKTLEVAEAERQKLISRYREPLARAVFDLQSRLYNILQQQLLETYFDYGSERSRAYVVDNTTFLIAQYFAWIEIIRIEINHIDLGTEDDSRTLVHLLDAITTIWADDGHPSLRLFAGEQRAIGEDLTFRGAQGLSCKGYSAFLGDLDSNSSPIIEAVRNDVRRLSTMLSATRPRAVRLQNSFIDLLLFLDPDYIRFPKKKRAKVML